MAEFEPKREELTSQQVKEYWVRTYPANTSWLYGHIRRAVWAGMSMEDVSRSVGLDTSFIQAAVLHEFDDAIRRMVLELFWDWRKTSGDNDHFEVRFSRETDSVGIVRLNSVQAKQIVGLHNAQVLTMAEEAMRLRISV